MAVASSRALGHAAANGLGPEIARGPSSVYGLAVAPPGTTQLAAKTTTMRAAKRKFIAVSFVHAPGRVLEFRTYTDGAGSCGRLPANDL
jgi:hypothetical protein